MRSVGLALAAIMFCRSATASPVRSEHVEAELISEVSAIRPAQPFWVGLRLSMDPGWHTYWVNPGSSGEAPAIAWRLPEGYSADPIVWPQPKRIPLPPLLNYGYETEVLLLVRINPGPSPPGETVRIEADVTWLECKVDCLPGEARFSLDLPVVSSETTGFTEWRAAFEKTRQALPREGTGWRTAAERTENGYRLEALSVRPDELTPSSHTDLFFFADRSGVIDPAAPQKLTVENDRILLDLSRSPYAPGEPAELTGVLVSTNPWFTEDSATGLIVRAPVSAPPSVAMNAGEFAAMIGVAFLGGILLNLMPCVFPVLSLKVLGFARQGGDSSRSIRAHGLLFGAGVLLSFGSLAELLVALRQAGAEVGWGFQLQSPGFVMAMSFLFTFLALNLFGVFEWGAAFSRFGGRLADRTGYAGSFFDGILATIVATPCTAPFMGTALGVAAILPSMQSRMLFLGLAAGFAAPYVLLSFAPGWVQRLPRPGAWMKTFKELMAFPLLGAAVWLVRVYGELTGMLEAGRLLSALVLASVGAWIYGKSAEATRTGASRISGMVVTLIILAGSIYWATGAGAPGRWKPYSPAAIEAVRRDGRPVFIDFTAAWCITCQVNKIVALESDAVEDAFRERGVVPFRADWTRRSPEIRNALAQYGRNSVPVYVYYPPGLESEPILLPEILTPGVVIEALAEAEKRSR